MPADDSDDDFTDDGRLTGSSRGSSYNASSEERIQTHKKLRGLKPGDRDSSEERHRIARYIKIGRRHQGKCGWHKARPKRRLK